MPMVPCRRCGVEKEGLPGPPFRGELGETIHASVCAECWQAWLGEQTIQMNERRLSLVRGDHQEIIRKLMRSFLGLEEEEPS